MWHGRCLSIYILVWQWCCTLHAVGLVSLKVKTNPPAGFNSWIYFIIQPVTIVPRFTASPGSKLCPDFCSYATLLWIWRRHLGTWIKYPLVLIKRLCLEVIHSKNTENIVCCCCKRTTDCLRNSQRGPCKMWRTRANMQKCLNKCVLS